VAKRRCLDSGAVALDSRDDGQGGVTRRNETARGQMTDTAVAAIAAVHRRRCVLLVQRAIGGHRGHDFVDHCQRGGRALPADRHDQTGRRLQGQGQRGKKGNQKAPATKRHGLDCRNFLFGLQGRENQRENQRWSIAFDLVREDPGVE